MRILYIFLSFIVSLFSMIEPATAKEVVANETTEAVEKEQEFAAYKIHGIMPNVEWQRVLYNELERRGIAWYMPYAVCQIYQESGWNQHSDNGQDQGITQQKKIYWYSRAERYGAKGASIWDVNAQFKVYAGMMADYLRVAKNDVGWALSYYFYGNGERADKYVNDVMSHMPYLERMER